MSILLNSPMASVSATFNFAPSWSTPACIARLDKGRWIRPVNASKHQVHMLSHAGTTSRTDTSGWRTLRHFPASVSSTIIRATARSNFSICDGSTSVPAQVDCSAANFASFAIGRTLVSLSRACTASRMFSAAVACEQQTGSQAYLFRVNMPTKLPCKIMIAGCRHWALLGKVCRYSSVGAPPSVARPSPPALLPTL